MNVNDTMMSQVKSCHPSSSLEDVAITMWNSDCGSVPIVDEQNKLIGIITDRDIAIGAALKHKALWEVSACEVTGDRPVFTCHPDDDIHTALAIMQRNKIRRLPIVNDAGELQGILSIGDVVALAEAKQGVDLSVDETMTMLKSVLIHH